MVVITAVIVWTQSHLFKSEPKQDLQKIQRERELEKSNQLFEQQKKAEAALERKRLEAQAKVLQDKEDRIAQEKEDKVSERKRKAEEAKLQREADEKTRKFKASIEKMRKEYDAKQRMKAKEEEKQRMKATDEEKLKPLEETKASPNFDYNRDLSILDYENSPNHKIDMLHDLFRKRFYEQNITGTINAEKNHTNGTLGFLQVLVNDIQIDIARMGENEFRIFINAELNPADFNLTDDGLDSYFDEVVDHVIHTHTFETMNMFEFKQHRGSYPNENGGKKYICGFFVDYNYQAFSIWGFANYVFEIWKDLHKLIGAIKQSNTGIF